MRQIGSASSWHARLVARVLVVKLIADERVAFPVWANNIAEVRLGVVGGGAVAFVEETPETEARR